MRLGGRVALITGGGSGIGAATARRFAAEGARLVLFDLNGDAAASLAAELGGPLTAVAVGGDASSHIDAERAVGLAVETFGGLDVVVNCAGADISAGALGELDDRAWRAGLDANLRTCMATTRAALPALVERQGSVVIISSVGGLSGAPQTVSYQTSKAALLGLMRSLAVDYGPKGVRVNAVCPGWVHTPMTGSLVEKVAAVTGRSADEVRRATTAVLPLRRGADPSEIAAVCLFLASEDASFVTGSVLVADGGISALNSGAAAFD